MSTGNLRVLACLALGGLLTGSPVLAGEPPQPIELVKCDTAMGAAAVIEGDSRSWVDKKLGSPKKLIEALAEQSGCFAPFDAASGETADFLLTIIAGDQVQVASATNLNTDRMATAAALAQNSGYRGGLGTVGDVAGMVPLAGAVVNGLAGIVGIGKKKTVATGLTLSSAMDGQVLAGGTGLVQDTRLKFHDDDDDAMALMPDGYWMAAVERATSGQRYTSKEDGREMVHGFVAAFNNMVAQARAMGVGRVVEEDPAPPEQSDPEPEANVVTVARESALYLEPFRDAEQVRIIRPGMKLTPIGDLEGIFMPVSDAYGVLGWVSVEDLE